MSQSILSDRLQHFEGKIESLEDESVDPLGFDEAQYNFPPIVEKEDIHLPWERLVDQLAKGSELLNKYPLNSKLLQSWQRQRGLELMEAIALSLYQDLGWIEFAKLCDDLACRDEGLLALDFALRLAMGEDKLRPLLYQLSALPREEKSIDLAWLSLVYRYLKDLWHQLALRGFVWQREDGQEAFFAALAERPMPRPSAVLARNFKASTSPVRD